MDSESVFAKLRVLKARAAVRYKVKEARHVWLLRAR